MSEPLNGTLCKTVVHNDMHTRQQFLQLYTLL